MAKVAGLLISAILTITGLILLIAWWYEFLFLLRGVVPCLLILGGGIWVVAGLTELKDMLKDKEAK